VEQYAMPLLTQADPLEQWLIDPHIPNLQI
jgi:hypothetical protein